MSFYDIIQVFGSNAFIYVGAFILVLSVLVFVHEYGHYIVARWCGVRVEVFSIGFGREIYGFTDKHNTRWKVSMIPLGGYVKLFGDVDPASAKSSPEVEDPNTHRVRPMTAEERKIAFFNQPVIKRAAIVFAGPAINYIFAIVILAAVFMFQGRPVTPPLAAGVIEGSAAQEAGFKPGDKVISINGESIGDFEEIRRAMMIGLDTPKHFEIERDGKIITIDAKPKKIEIKDRFGFKHESGRLGLISPVHAVQIKNIVKVDGMAYDNPDDVRKALTKNLEKTFTIEIKGDGTEANDVLIVNPIKKYNEKMNLEGAIERDLLFLADGETRVLQTFTPPMAVVESLKHTWAVTVGTLRALGQIITGTRSPTELGGVIRIGALAGDMAQQGIIAFILFAALLSINLGLVNLFPIPMLDGGHLVFYAFEAVLGKPIPERIQEYAFNFGLLFLVSLMVFANLNDIMQLFLHTAS
jgi:regulator of sigma E protease